MSTATLEPAISAELPNRTYDARDLAALFGIHYRTVLEWAKAGVIPRGHRFGRKTLRWTAADIAPLLASRQEG